MSIESLIGKFGQSLYLWRPTITISTDGTVVRTMLYVDATGVGFRGFIQPSGQSADVFEGRQNSRTNVTIYAKGSIDARIDDEIYFVNGVTTIGNTRVLRVVGKINPADLGNSLADSFLSMTVIEAVEILPTIQIQPPIE